MLQAHQPWEQTVTDVFKIKSTRLEKIPCSWQAAISVYHAVTTVWNFTALARACWVTPMKEEKPWTVWQEDTPLPAALESPRRRLVSALPQLHHSPTQAILRACDSFRHKRQGRGGGTEAIWPWPTWVSQRAEREVKVETKLQRQLKHQADVSTGALLQTLSAAYLRTDGFGVVRE